MSEEILDQAAPGGAETEAPYAPPQPAVGEQLRTAREAKGLHAADVAQALKISARQVEALEAGDWSALPGQTFVRGFVRNYARLLRLDPDLLIRELDTSLVPQLPRLDMPASTSATLPQAGGAQRRDLVAVFAGLLLMAMALLAYFFIPPDFWQSRVAGWFAPSPSVEAPAGAVQEPPAAAADAAAEPAQAPVAAPPAVAETPSPTTASAPTAVPATPHVPPTVPTTPPVPAQQTAEKIGSSGVQLSFAQASWVEIRDRSGQIIFSQLNPAGTQRYVEGEPPFALVIGNATHVTVKYKGKPVDLAQRSKDDVARLTLE